MSSRLGHGDGARLRERVVVEVDVAQVVVHCERVRQRCDAGLVDAVLWHLHFFQGLHRLQTAYEVKTSLKCLENIRCLALNASARAVDPSSSSRPRPETKTRSASGVPAAELLS